MAQTTITPEQVRNLASSGRTFEAIIRAFVVQSYGFEALPDAGDELFGRLFTGDECQAFAEALELAEEYLSD